MDRSLIFLLTAALAWLAAGCQPDIGDACELPSDCSASGDRICDTTFKGGYCTQFNCEPGDCPDEAVCVAFLGAASSAPECQDVQETPRFERTFCMKSCEDNGDCRTEEGYRCIDVESDKVEPWSASVVEKGHPNTKVCMPPYEGSSGPAGETEVCAPPADASFPPPLQSLEAGAPQDARVPTDAQSLPDASTLPDASAVPDASDAAVAPLPDAAPVDAGVGG